MQIPLLRFSGLLFIALLVSAPVFSQQPGPYPPYTLVSRTTEYDAHGNVISVRTATAYHSASGDWRSVGRTGADEYATLYRRGQGVYKSSSRSSRTIKQTDHAPGCPIRTAEELRRDPKFTRMEELLGYTAYVWTEHIGKDLQVENYFVPELGGGTPIKQVSAYTNGPKFESEPISITLGEPDPNDITGPNYLVIEQEPIFLHKLPEQVLTKADPKYPSEALLREWSGDVMVMVTVDESGNVLVAGALPGNSSEPVRDAAVEAAYKTTFKPTFCNGKPIMVSGIIDIKFDLAQQTISNQPATG